MGHAIFISYRRDDAEGEAGRLFDDLTRAFGETCVFMDVAGISPGVDFRKAIEENVAECGVLLAVIGPEWVTMPNADGHPRLNDANDFVRLEIVSALKRNVAVIPVLVHEARMPRPESLPDDLKDLCYRNSVELSHARWNSDVALLINALKSYVKSTPASEQQPVHATVSVQLPAPHPAEEAAPPAKRSMPPWLQGAAVAAVLVIAAVAYFGSHRQQPAPLEVAKPPSNGSDPSQLSVAAAAPAKADSPAVAPAPGPSQDAPGKDAPAKPDADNEQGVPPAAATPAGPSAAEAAAAPLRGRWVVISPGKADNLAVLEIAGSADKLVMRAWGSCQLNGCDWGEQQAAFDGRTATAKFPIPDAYERPGVTRVAVITVARGLNGLDADVHNTFTRNGQSEQVAARLQLVPAP